MKEQEIQEKIEELERDKMGYLEVNDKAGARRKQNKINELEMHNRHKRKVHKQLRGVSCSRKSYI